MYSITMQCAFDRVDRKYTINYYIGDFTITYNSTIQTIACVCSANHVTGLYQKTTSFTFSTGNSFYQNLPNLILTEVYLNCFSIENNLSENILLYVKLPIAIKILSKVISPESICLFFLFFVLNYNIGRGFLQYNNVLRVNVLCAIRPIDPTSTCFFLDLLQ